MNKILRPLIVLATALSLAPFTLAELSIGTKAPELVGSQWTGGAKSLASLRGKVVLVHFWTFGCINCKHNLPAYARLQKAFADEPVATIGVHTPETQEEQSFSNVKEAVTRLGVHFDTLFDPANKNWDRYQVHYWPTLYVLDKRGIVRGVWIGELNYGGQNGEAEAKELIAKLVRE